MQQPTNPNQPENGGHESAEASAADTASRFGLNSLEVETARSVYFDTAAIREPGYVLYRADGGRSGDARWYWEPDADQYYGSTTSVIDATQPTPYGILDFLKRLGEKADDYRDLRARYGTWLHINCVRLLIDGEIDLEAVVETMPDPGLELEAQKDLLAFEAFRRQHQIHPLAIEAVLKSDEFQVAGAVDLVALMRIGSGKGGNWIKADAGTQGVPVLGVVDYKSGKGGFYPKHGQQLRIYRAMVAEEWPDLGRVAVEYFRETGDEATRKMLEGVEELPLRMFNWSPSDWKVAPSWSFKEWHEETEADRSWRTMIRLFNQQNEAPKPRLAIAGKITRTASLSSLYRFETIKDRVLESDELTRTLEASIEKEADNG